MPIKVFAFSHRDEIVKKSASGGAFSAIAEAFFSTNPEIKKVVYGVTLDQDMQAVYRAAETLEECTQFKGSKYVRSHMQGLPESIAGHLQAGVAVLFVGTPCFVYALKAKLNKRNVPTDKLLCVDLICHGTPEPQYWTAYKQWLEKKNRSKLTKYQFRTHIPGKGPYTAIAEFESGKKRIGTLETAIFNRLFLRHYTLADGCFQCRFANLDRQGDLTIGDFWGIEQVMPDFPRDKGVSEILVNTEKGVAIADWMKECSQWDMQECRSMDFVQYQNNLQRPADRPENLDVFRADFRAKGFTYVAKKYAGYDLLRRLKSKLSR